MMAGFSPVQDSSAQLLRHGSCFGVTRSMQCGGAATTTGEPRNIESTMDHSIWNCSQLTASSSSSTDWNGYLASFPVGNKNKNATNDVSSPISHSLQRNGVSPPVLASEGDPELEERRAPGAGFDASTQLEVRNGRREEEEENDVEISDHAVAKTRDDDDGDDDDDVIMGSSETCGQCCRQFPSLELYMNHRCEDDSTVHHEPEVVVEEEEEEEEEEGEEEDGETFDGKIVYNPDGSAYIIEGELDSEEAQSLVNDVPRQEGTIIEHGEKVMTSTSTSPSAKLSYPRIASAVYIRCPRSSSSTAGSRLHPKPSEPRPHSEAPIMHSYRVLDLRSGANKRLEGHGTGDVKTGLLPAKPILMCFVCKLSFGVVKSFVLHASNEHQMTLNEDERSAMLTFNASAIIQCIGPDRLPHLSFLESLTSPLPDSDEYANERRVITSHPDPTTSGLSAVQRKAPDAKTVHENVVAQRRDHRQNSNPSEETTVDSSEMVEFRNRGVQRETTRPSPVAGGSSSLDQSVDQFGLGGSGAYNLCGALTQGGPSNEKNNNSINTNSSETVTNIRQSSSLRVSSSSSSIIYDNMMMSLSSSSSLAQPFHHNTSIDHVTSPGLISSCLPVSLGGVMTATVPMRNDAASSDILHGIASDCDVYFSGRDRSPAGQMMTSLHSRNSCKTLKCPKCNWHYKYQETLEIHMKEKHPETETQCGYCIGGQPHPRLARGESYTCGYKPYRCDICNYSTTTKGNLSIHLQSDKHSNNMQELQSNNGNNSGTSNAGDVKVVPAPVPAPGPPAVAQSASGMAGTPRKTKQKATWRCDFCSYETTEARNLRIHMTSEKHAHNLMALQQNMRQIQMNHQMALLSQDPSGAALLGLPSILGLQPPPSAFDPAMFLSPFLPSLPETPIDLTKPVLPDVGPSVLVERLTDEGRRLPGRSGMFTCAICNVFSSDSIDLLQHHIQLDRSKTVDQESISVVGGTYHCNLCQYKTTLKANFQLHCKTDKHLQRLQLINHIQEGGGCANELNQKFLSSGSPVQVWCSACNYHTNSIYRLQMHVVGCSHETNARIFSHLQVEEEKLSVASGRWSYRCSLCSFTVSTKYGLIEHAQSESHALKDQRISSCSSTIMAEKTAVDRNLGYFSAVEDDDSMIESDGEDSAAGSVVGGDDLEVQRGASSGDLEDRQSDAMKRCSDRDLTLTTAASSSYSSLPLRSLDSTENGSTVTYAEQGTASPSSASISCLLCMEEISNRGQLRQHLLEVHKVKVETLQSIMKLANSADHIAPLHLASSRPTSVTPVDTEKVVTNASELPKNSVNSVPGCKDLSNSGFPLSSFSLGGTGSPRLFQNCPRVEVDGNKNDGTIYNHRTDIVPMEEAAADSVVACDKEIEDHTQCQTCLRKFPTIESLYSHQIELGHLELKQTSTGPGYLCWHKGCNQYFKTAIAVQVHHREIHVYKSSKDDSEQNEYSHRCVQCNLLFKTLEQLQVHSYYHVIRSASDCVVCGQSFPSALEAKTHLEKCHTEVLTQEQLAKYQAHADVASSLALLGASCLDGLSNTLSIHSEEKRQKSSLSDPHTTVPEEENDQVTCRLESVKDIEIIAGKFGELTGNGNQDTLLKLDENSNANISDTIDEGSARPTQSCFDEDITSNRFEGEGNYSSLKYKCHRCKVGFPKMSYLSAHNKTLQHRQGSKLSHPLEKYFDPNRPYKCEVCMESFTQKNILLVHYNSVSHLHRLKQQQQQPTGPQTPDPVLGELPMETGQSISNDGENSVTEEMEVGDEDISKQESVSTSSVDNLVHVSHHSVITSVGKVGSANSGSDGKMTADPVGPIVKTMSSSVVDNVTHVASTATNTADETIITCDSCGLDFHKRSLFEVHRCQDRLKTSEMSTPPQSKPSSSHGPPKAAVPEFTGVRFPGVQWSSMMQSSTSLTSTSVPLTAPVFTNVFPDLATVSLVANGQSALPASSLPGDFLPGKSAAGGVNCPLPANSLGIPLSTAYDTLPNMAKVLEIPPKIQNSLFCHRCRTVFTSADCLTQHLQMCICGSEHSSLSQVRPANFGRSDLIAASFKPRVQQTLLENFGFDCVMQFNECRQKVKSPISKADDLPEKEKEMDRRNVEKEISAGSNGKDDDLPELRRCFCCLCAKEFSSVWVLKAHEEEVHKELLPSNLIQEFGKQFRKLYERRVQPTETRISVNNLTGKSSIEQNRKQDFSSIPEKMSKPEESLVLRNPGLSGAEMAAMQTAQMMQQLPLMMGLNLLPPPMVPMMMPLGAELFGLPPFPLMDPMLMFQQQQNQNQNQKVGALTLGTPNTGVLHQKSARTRITDDQLCILRAHFDINNSPSELQIREMSEKTGLVPKVIKHWFRNTLFKERQRNKDSPYNFSNPPSTTFNLEEYEKLNHYLIKKEKGTDGTEEQPENSPVTSLSRTPTSAPINQSSHQNPREGEPRITAPIKIPPNPAFSPHTTPRLAFPAPLMSSGSDLSNAVLSNLMHLPPLYLPSPAMQGSSVSKVGLSQVPGMGVFAGSAGAQERRANRTRFTKHQIRVLQEFFEQNAYPKDEELENLSKLLDLSPRVIVVWFQNARQKVRKNFENQPAMDMSEDGATSTNSAMVPFPTGSNYQCKKCLTLFQSYEDLVKHKRNLCFKEEENCYVSVSNSAISGDVSDDDEDKVDGASHSSIESEFKGFGGVSSGIEYCCEKCNLIFYHLDKWKEHQSIHAASLGLSVPQGSMASIAGKNRVLEREKEKEKVQMEGFPSVNLDDASQARHWSDDGDEKDDQPRDKRIRTTILPEQLDYLYHKYQSDCNPSRKQLDAIAVRVGLKKRVVQVWFQNTRARERKGQYRAHQQLIHKRCPFCKALFRAKTALEAHLTSKHPEEMSRREINIDTIPDEPTEPPAPVEAPVVGTNSNTVLGFAKTSTSSVAGSYGMSNSFLCGIQNMRNLGSSELLHPNMQRLYEDSFKKYIDELSHVSHQSKPEHSTGFRPELTSSATARIKQEDSPLDLSMTIKSADYDQRSLDDVPGSRAVQRTYLPDDSHSESHSEDNNDEGSGAGAESGPPSPSSSASNQSKQAPGLLGKRYRTQMSSLQIKVMKSIFTDYKTPTMAECEALGHEIGLPKRVVQVWFQNARAKEKKWSLLYTEGGGSNPSSSAICPELSIPVSNSRCSLCDVVYSPQHSIQDHLFTRKHIDKVKSNLRKSSMRCQKEMTTPSTKDSGGMETPRSGKVVETEARNIGRSNELSSVNNSFHDSATPSTLHSICVNQTTGFPSHVSEKKSKSEAQSTGILSHKVKVEKGDLLRNVNADMPTGLRLPLNQIPSSAPVIHAVKPTMAPGNILGQFGNFPGLPAVPNPSEMMTMMPYLFPCLTGFYPTGGMPYMPTSVLPGLDNMFMYDPVNFGTPLSLLQIPPACIKIIQEKLQDKDCTLTHYTQDCHSFADLRRWVTDEDWSVARKATVDVGYICKKCQVVYPGRSACVVHQQTTCFPGATQNIGDSGILKLEQLQYECSACSVKCCTIAEFKGHCSKDFHKQHLVSVRKGQLKFNHVVGNALAKTKPNTDLDNEGVVAAGHVASDQTPSKLELHD